MPRGRGGRWARGRGGRGTNNASRGGRFSKPAAPFLRKSARTTSNLSESNPSNLDDQAGVYATWNSAARLFTIHGLTDEDFERWGQEEDLEGESVVDEENGDAENSLNGFELDEGYQKEPPPKASLSQYDEVWMTPPRRGFYKPPPMRVWRKKSDASLENGEINRSVDNEDGPEDSHNLDLDEEKEDQDEARSNHRQKEIAAPDIIVSTEDVPNAHDHEALMEEDTASEAEDEPVEMIDEGALSDGELPPPFFNRPPTPDEADCDDAADFIMRTRFAPLPDAQALVKALTKYPTATRATAVLYKLAANTQRALQAWQDEYLKLDARTAPHSNPPKKPATGGRYPIDSVIYEDMKEADLYGYIFDPKRGPGLQNPFAQRPGGSDGNGGRELRQRRARELGEEPSDDEGTGTEVGKRKRKAVVRYDGEPRGTRGRKRALDSEPPEYDGPPRKRGRPSAAEKAQIHQNIRRIREESAIGSTISESESMSPGPNRRRGRPPGSRNLAPRSDVGIKKGPRRGRPARSAEPDSLEAEDEFEQGTANGRSADVSVTGLEDPFVESVSQSKAIHDEDAARSAGTSTPATEATTQGPLNKRKQRVKSEKRSESMTLWWAARKAKQSEERRKAQEASLEQQRLADQQRADNNNFNNRFWMNDPNPLSGQRNAGPAIAPAPQHDIHSSPMTPPFIMSGHQPKSYDRKRGSPLKHEHARNLSRDFQDIAPPPPPPQGRHLYSPPMAAYPPPPVGLQPISQPGPVANPFGHQLSPVVSFSHIRQSSLSSLPPPPPPSQPSQPSQQSYAPSVHSSPISGQGPPPPPLSHVGWSLSSYPPPPPSGYQQPPYMPPPQGSSHQPPPPLTHATPPPAPPLQSLQGALPPPPLSQQSPPGSAHGLPDHWRPREWARPPPVLEGRPQLAPPAHIFDPKQEAEAR